MTTDRYRAANDPAHFPEEATREEQIEALDELDFDTLEELWESIHYYGDTFPGRTSAESVEMIDEVMIPREREDTRGKWIRAAVIVAVAVVVIVGGQLLAHAIWRP